MRLIRLLIPCLLLAAAGLFLADSARRSQGAGQPRILAWNDRGLHEMEADYSVYAMALPGNHLRAQVVDGAGRYLNPQSGVGLTYEAVADPGGSINSRSSTKTNFWTHVFALLGRTVPADLGLAGSAMPGAANAPQPMHYDANRRRWIADGIPMTPLDDAGLMNPYPVIRVKAHNSSGSSIASVDAVLAVSTETQCRACHGSNTMGAARPEDGWVNDPDPERDYRLNVLRRHDDKHLGDSVYAAGLAASGYLAAGLFATVMQTEKPILCAACHASPVGGGAGRTDTSTLTRAMHYRHAGVTDPATGKTLNATNDRSSCYTCHAGPETQHLRGAMGRAVAADGSRSIQCQSCHGPLRDVASRDRRGWVDLPDCQSCHTGHATKNAGELRYTSAFEAGGQVRQAVDPIWATNANAPAAGQSLYRESTAHHGLACASCHGITHAEFPSGQPNDNLMPIEVQGHGGLIDDCASCHGTQPNTVTGGPHNMHPVGQDWIRGHERPGRDNIEGCRTCHGADDRGTVFSRMLADRRIQSYNQQLDWWRGYTVGCYNCHNGPREERRSANRAPEVQHASLATERDQSVATDLAASDADGNALTLRIVTQPTHGTVALSARHATYLPDKGFAGTDRFTFAAWDGSTDSNLGAVDVRVTVGGVLPSVTPTRVAPTATRPGPTVEPSPTPVSSTPTPVVVITPGPDWWRVFVPVVRKRY